LHFQGQTTNACTFLLINVFLNENKESNLTTNHRSPRAKRFTNYALKARMEEVYIFKWVNYVWLSKNITAGGSRRLDFWPLDRLRHSVFALSDGTKIP
jgi:hypothetical protein